MHDAYISGRSENNIKCVVMHNDLGRKSMAYIQLSNKTSQMSYVLFCP